MNGKWLLVLLAAVSLGGCAQLLSPRVPSTTAEYDAVQKTDPQRFSRTIIVLHNLQRVLDNDVKPADRVASLQLVTQLAPDDKDVTTQLANLLTDPKAPLEVQQAVLSFLLKKDQPDLAAHVLAAMGNLNKYSELHDSILAWLAKHPTGEVLSELVKLWAQEDPQGPNEARYRSVIEKTTGSAWDDALVNALNSNDFSAPGAAMAVLLKRMPEPTLRQRLSAMTARSSWLAVLQTFLRQFDWLPASDEEFTTMVQVGTKNRGTVDDAAKLAAQWRADYGYRFNIRDFHLLSRLAQDPLRTAQRRPQLIQEIGTSLSTRRHVDLPGGVDDKFFTRADTLTLADLWNLYLLSDLLSRPRTQMAMWVLADGDRADRSGAWGGLVFYRAGQAEATKYPTVQRPESAGPGGGPPSGDDLIYAPQFKGKRASGDYDFLGDSRDSLTRFICHFEKADNVGRAGPTPAELRDARVGNYYGLVLTSLGADSFCAHYFNPQGVVISLGVFPLRKVS